MYCFGCLKEPEKTFNWLCVAFSTNRMQKKALTQGGGWEGGLHTLLCGSLVLVLKEAVERLVQPDVACVESKNHKEG
jgi:hypothetical protein